MFQQTHFQTIWVHAWVTDGFQGRHGQKGWGGDRAHSGLFWQSYSTTKGGIDHVHLFWRLSPEAFPRCFLQMAAYIIKYYHITTLWVGRHTYINMLHNCWFLRSNNALKPPWQLILILLLSNLNLNLNCPYMTQHTNCFYVLHNHSWQDNHDLWFCRSHQHLPHWGCDSPQPWPRRGPLNHSGQWQQMSPHCPSWRRNSGRLKPSGICPVQQLM